MCESFLSEYCTNSLERQFMLRKKAILMCLMQHPLILPFHAQNLLSACEVLLVSQCLNTGQCSRRSPTSLWDGMWGSMQHAAVTYVYNKFPISGTHSGTHQYMHLGKKIQCRLVGLTAQLLSTLNMKDTSMCLVHTPFTNPAADSFGILICSSLVSYIRF